MRPDPAGSDRRLRLVAKIMFALGEAIILVLALSFLEFRPPRPIQPPLYRIAPGVASLQFYSIDCAQPRDKPQYSYRFPDSAGRCIFVRLYPSSFSGLDPYGAIVQMAFQGPGPGAGQAKQVILHGITPPAILLGYTGRTGPGSLRPGLYRVELRLRADLLASGDFQIVAR